MPARRSGDLVAEVRIVVSDEAVKEHKAIGGNNIVAGLGEAVATQAVMFRSCATTLKALVMPMLVDSFAAPITLQTNMAELIFERLSWFLGH